MTAYNLHALSTRETNYEEYSEWRFFLFAFKFFFFFFFNYSLQISKFILPVH